MNQRTTNMIGWVGAATFLLGELRVVFAQYSVWFIYAGLILLVFYTLQKREWPLLVFFLAMSLLLLDSIRNGLISALQLFS